MIRWIIASVSLRMFQDLISSLSNYTFFLFLAFRDCLAFCTEPVFASLSNVLGQWDNLPSPVPNDIKEYKLFDVETKYGLLQVRVPAGEPPSPSPPLSDTAVTLLLIGQASVEFHCSPVRCTIGWLLMTTCLCVILNTINLSCWAGFSTLLPKSDTLAHFILLSIEQTMLLLQCCCSGLVWSK